MTIQRPMQQSSVDIPIAEDAAAPCAAPSAPSQSLASKTGWNAMASFISLCGRLVVQVVIARMLGPDGVGRIAYMVWLIEIANLLVCFGLPSSLTRYLAELHGQQKLGEASRFAQWVFIRYLLLTLLGSVTVGILFFSSSQYSGAESALPALMLLFLVYGLQAINQADLAGRQRFDLLARINIAATAVLVTGVIAGGYFYGVTGVLYGYLGGAVAPAVYSLSMLRGHSLRRRVDEGLRRRVWKFTFNTWLAMLVSAFVWSRMEVFFLERYWDAREVAMFTVALTFAMIVRQVATLFSGAFLAHFSHLVGHGNHELIQRQYETATRLMAFVVIPVALGGAAIMPALVPLLFGPAFTPAVPSAMVLTATSGLAVSLIGSALVYAKERSGFIALSGLGGAVLSVIAGFVIVSRFGVWGAVWSRLCIQTLMFGLGVCYITTRLRFTFPVSSVSRTFASAAVCSMVAWCVVDFIQAEFIALCIAVPSGAVAYAIAAGIFDPLTSDDKRRFSDTARTILNRVRQATRRVSQTLVAASNVQKREPLVPRL